MKDGESEREKRERERERERDLMQQAAQLRRVAPAF